MICYTPLMNEKKRKLLVILHLRTVAGRRHLSGILDYADGKPDWELLLFEPDQLTNIAHFKRLLDNEGLDGAIITLPLASPIMAHLIRTKLALVFDNVPNVKLPVSRPRASFIYTDNEDVGRKSSEHLLSLGKFRSFGFVNHPSNEFWSHEREQAFKKCVAKHAPFFTYVNGTLETWLMGLPKPTGIMIAGDDHTIPIVKACHKCGLDIPRQVAIVCSGMVTSSARGNSTLLSSVTPDMHTLGYRSAKEMDRLLRKGSNSVAREIVIAAKDVVIRDSSAPAVPAAQLVTDIKNFIAAHFTEDISVTDILATMKCSRRLAELRFRQIEGTSIRQALENIRLQEAMKLLRVTNDSATQIAHRCGHNPIERCPRLFVRETGQTIRETRHLRTNPA